MLGLPTDSTQVSLNNISISTVISASAIFIGNHFVHMSLEWLVIYLAIWPCTSWVVIFSSWQFQYFFFRFKLLLWVFLITVLTWLHMRIRGGEFITLSFVQPSCANMELGALCLKKCVHFVFIFVWYCTDRNCDTVKSNQCL